MSSPLPAVLAGGGGDRAADPMLTVPSGEFLMGSEDREINPGDGENPVRRVAVEQFALGSVAVTNGRFAAFVEETGYVTEAERYGWSFVFHPFVAPELLRRIERVPALTPWWLPVPGASWRAPEGPGSAIDDRWDHPVVHVSWNDAMAYCQWFGLRLPTEAEWEYSARGGLEQARFPWGDELVPRGRHRCNVWQGRFPYTNTGEDGWIGAAPVGAYEANGYGFYNMVGNVWEWCADTFTGEAPSAGGAMPMRGGSYLCHHSYCNRYRVSARTGNTPDSAAGNIGFRVAANLG